MYALGGWYCRLCQVGEFCFNNTNRTCPDHSSSFGVAKTYSDCYCNAGYKNTTAKTEASFCEDCPANSFCTGKGSVQACTANAVAPVQSTSYLRCYCSWGWKGVNNSACVGCQSPTFCYGGVEAQCSEGTYSGALSWNRLNCSCIPGRWGPAGGPCILCGAGKYNLIPGCKACSNTSDVDCELCGLGTASSVLGRNSTCDVCGAGKFSFPANQRGAFTCEKCAAGTISGIGASNCTSCASGYVAVNGSNVCTPCAAGTISGIGASACTPCSNGYFAVSGSSVCTPCPAGTFATGLVGSCAACGAGNYSLLGATTCSTCSVCAIGQYNVSNCISSANIVCGACTNPLKVFHAGRHTFTSTGLAGEQSCSWCCNPGLYLTLVSYGFHACTGVGVSASWAQCGIRYNCPDNSQTYITSPDTQTACTCNAGYTGVGGWNTTWQNFPADVQLQPPSNWSGVNCNACPSGTYSTGTGVTLSSRCLSCIAGTYNTGIGAPASNQCLACTAGTYSTGMAASNSSQCSSCQMGTYQTGLGASLSSACQNCLEGTYSAVSGAIDITACANCITGKYGTMLGSPSSGNCLDCGYGKYNPVQGADDPSDCLSCASGTYTGVNGTTNCSECGVGSFAVTEASVCSLCSPGTFAAARASSCGVCPPGLFSTPDSPICLACAPGEYNDRNASANCSLCEAGRYSTGGASGCLTCTYGTYSSGSGFWYCNECDNGRFTGDGSSAVRLIPCFALFPLL